MRIAILGGGFTGLTAAYYLAKKGHSVTIFEKEKILGGLASGFKSPGWDWYLERTYHHFFTNDVDILNFAKEVGFEGIFFKAPETASLYELSHAGFISVVPLDTPLDLLRFPLLNITQKIRTGFVLAFLKLSPFFSFYEKQSAEEFLKKSMGNDVWNILWQELFRKKFGKYAGKVLSSFFWARIKKRTKNLGYVKGGFQTFINFLEEKNIQSGAVVKKACQINKVIKAGKKFLLDHSRRPSEIVPFDVVISTLPTPVIVELGSGVFSQNYLNQLKKIQYLHAVNLIIETEKPLLDKTYWLGNCVKEIPFMVAVQHTNFVNKKHYGNRHLLYVGNYVDTDDKLFTVNEEAALSFFLPYLKRINSEFIIHNSKFYLFKAPFAQPIFDAAFLKSKPDFITPVKNFYIANLDMTYPHDRGTNYAVALGKKVAQMI